MSTTAQEVKDKVTTFFSGGPGTTGREPFEDGTAPLVGADGKPVNPTSGGELHIQSLPAGTHTGLHTSVLDSVPSDLTARGAHSRDHVAPGQTHQLGQSGTGSGLSGDASRRDTEGDGLHHPASGGQRVEGTGFNGAGNHTDRVGALDQDLHKYESTAGDNGPNTAGAAGTDRFDTDKSRSGVTSSDVREPVGPQGDELHKTKSSGGVAGVLATSDHDFTENRSRVGGASGAYADSHGHFKGNTSGPNGHTALTGREGTVEKNPVARAKSRETGEPLASDKTAEHGHEKKGLMDKVKDALHK